MGDIFQQWNAHCILSYFITSLGCTNLLRYGEKQWKCNWKSNTNIMAFNAFQNHLMQWYCKKYWALLESSILRPSLLFVFMISPVTYFVCRCGWMHYCETAEKLYLPLFVCPSIPHRWHLHLSEFYDILDHTDHTFSESSWHPLTFWPSDHSPTQTHRTVGPTKPTQNPDLTIYGVLHYTYKPDIFWSLMAPTFLWQWVLATATYWKSSWRKKWAQITRYKHILFKFRI